MTSLRFRQFKRLPSHYSHFAETDPVAAREAYFASKTVPKWDEREDIDIALDQTKQRKEEREAAKHAFSLIMRKKEQLRSFAEPVSFIFARSALKEGWDNPNVFQICTLNQTTSEMKKRQEIGRGLRLAVNQRGERVEEEDLSVLTVVANQSFHSYAEQLQNEYVEERHEDEATTELPGAEGRGPARGLRDLSLRAEPRSRQARTVRERGEDGEHPRPPMGVDEDLRIRRQSGQDERRRKAHRR